MDAGRVKAGSRSGLRLLAGGLVLLSLACTVARRPAVGPSSSGGSSRALHVRVLATHDFHGALRPTTYAWSNGRPVGGASALKGVMDALEAACACPTVRLDGGDQMQGTLESNLALGASAVAALNHLGVDAAAVGNHELDWGVDTLLSRQREARYPWLAANVFNVDDGQRAEWARPHAIVERDGVTIGVVGYATVNTPRTLRPDVTKPYVFRSGYAGIRDALEAVWREHPDFVVIVAHAGGGCGPGGCAGEMVDLASELPPGRVHLIVGGHDHDAGDGIVQGIPIVRAGSNGRAVGVIDLYRRANGAYAFRMAQQTVFADTVPEDQALAALLAPYMAAADARGKELVTTLAEPLSATATGDRRLGHLIAEAARLFARADIGLHNPGGVRADLPRGSVSYADLHRVMPFDNAVVRLTLSGTQLRQIVEQAGPRYYFSNLPTIRDDGAYTLATSDFLADGGDGFAMLAEIPHEVMGITLLDALVQHLRALPAPVALPVERDRG